METIFTSLVILLGIVSVAIATIYFMYRTDKVDIKYPVHSDITYDHIEEDIVKIAQRKKRKAANAKRKSTTIKRTKSNDKGNSMA